MGITASKLRELLPVCRLCEGNWATHWYAVLASCIVDSHTISRVTEFFRLAEQHNWRALATFQEWNGLRDIAEAFAIACPSGAKQVIVLRDPYDYLQASELCMQEALTADESDLLCSLIPPEKWEPFTYLSTKPEP